MKRNIHLSWFYNHPPEKVWKCLTTPELIGQWLMKNDFKPEVGHKFEFRADPVPGWSGIVYCEVTEVLPMKRLSYSWKSGKKPGDTDISTTVTWILEAQDNGTHLQLEHNGFSGLKQWLISFMLQKGWKGHIAKEFAGILETL